MINHGQRIELIKTGSYIPIFDVGQAAQMNDKNRDVRAGRPIRNWPARHPGMSSLAAHVRCEAEYRAA